MTEHAMSPTSPARDDKAPSAPGVAGGGKWVKGVCRAAVAFLFAVIAWTSLGHHRYALAGDPSINFIQMVTLRHEFFRANTEALSRRFAGASDREAGHVKLKVEAGFPLLLLLARQFGERAPFMVNALLLPLLLWFFARCLIEIDHARDRGLFGAVSGVLLLLALPRSSYQFWSLALPFRDTLSHTLGFGALFLLWRACNRGSRPALWAWLAGALIGLSGFSRLSGFLFIIPAGCMVLTEFRGLGWRRRVGCLCALGAGMSMGLMLVMAQNVFEGRLLFQVPQSESLFLRNRPAYSHVAVRKGWHPANIPAVFPMLREFVWNIFPAPVSAALLVCVGGWALARRREALRALSLLGGIAAFTLFYACYDKVVGRYAYIIAIFVIMLFSLGAGWLADLIVRGLSWRRPATHAPLVAAAVAGFSVWIAWSALASSPDWDQVRLEWKTARSFRAWARRAVPEHASVLVTPQHLGVWLRYFHPSVGRWGVPVRDWSRPDPAGMALTGTPTLLMSPFSRDPGDHARGWIWDAVLSRYDVDPFGEPLAFPAEGGGGVRLFKVEERSKLSQTVGVERRSDVTSHLYLYLRDWPSNPAGDRVELAADSWPRAWPVLLRPGVNIVAIPDDLVARPAEFLLRGDEPLPSVLESAWVGREPVPVVLSDYDRIASRLMLVDGVSVSWRGYRNWHRDWGAFSARHWALPRINADEGFRARLPSLSLRTDETLVVRLFFSALSQDQEGLAKMRGGAYRIGARRWRPLVAQCNPDYVDQESFVVSDFIHEFEIDPAFIDGNGCWIEMERAASSKDERLFLHQIEYEVMPRAPGRDLSVDRRSGDAGTLGWTWRPPPFGQWLARRFESPPWMGRDLLPFMRQVDACIEPQGQLFVDGLLHELWEAYGAAQAQSVRDLWVEKGRASMIDEINSALKAGRAVHVLDSSDGLGREDGALRLVAPYYDVSVAMTMKAGNVSAPDGTQPAASALYRLHSWRENRVETQFASGPLKEGILRVEAKALWRSDMERTFAHLRLNGNLVDQRVANGARYYFLSSDVLQEHNSVDLQSDGPLPGCLSVDLLAPEERLHMMFSPGAAGSHAHWLDPFPSKMDDCGIPRMEGHEIRVSIPRVWPMERYGVLAEMRMRHESAASVSCELTVSQRPVESSMIDADGDIVVVFMLPDEKADADVVVQWSGSDTPRPAIGLSELWLTPIALNAPRGVRLGDGHDAAFIGGGVYGRERFNGSAPFRWTSDSAVLYVYEPDQAMAGAIRLVYHDGRPAAAPPANLRVSVNGIAIEGRDAGASEVSPFRVWQGQVADSQWRAGKNVIRVDATPWTPSALGDASDSRLLGVMLHRLEFVPR